MISSRLRQCRLHWNNWKAQENRYAQVNLSAWFIYWEYHVPTHGMRQRRLIRVL